VNELGEQMDVDALRRQYARERDKRLRPDGTAQYRELDGQLSHGLDDPYLPVEGREPKQDHVTVAVIGGGFAGLVTGARLHDAGITDVRIVEKGGDFGGTWYWNRYPGAQCDTASLIYLPLLEETGYMPTEHYAHAPEILGHCQRIGKQYGLYDGALFHTRVTALGWDDERGCWLVQTDRGDAFTAQYVTIGTGPLHVPKLPGIAGIERFGGHAFHTSRWDYDYTGGDPAGAPMERLNDKRVALIGTGATSVQCVPHLAEACEQLYVFQRTPSSVDERNNRPVDPEWFASISGEGWQQRWIENFVANLTMGELPEEDLVDDGWTDLGKRMRERMLAVGAQGASIGDVIASAEAADFEKMSEIRARVDGIVEDPDTAAQLKAWYRQLCKRPCFHDEYLDAYNRPNVTLVDTDGHGVERITEQGLVVAGIEHEVDCIIYASGFEVGAGVARRNGFEVTGHGGRCLSDYWADGMRSKHGIHVHGFPNLFLVQFSQGANFVANVPTNLTDSATTVAAVLRRAAEQGATRVEVTKEAEDEWVDTLVANPMMMSFLAECTPGYYNGEGQGAGPDGLFSAGFPMGASAYFRYIDEWRRSGDFEGLAFS
jgi:cation diffusion facilitator CzcD-associated flavoprotein CzcO